MSKSALGLFGGTFDPIHFGHLIIARSVLERLELEELLFIPSAVPPHKVHGQLSDFQHRAAMVRLAVEGEPGFGLNECEQQRSGPSYTLHTVAHFKARRPDAALSWIIGADSLADLHTWYHVGELIDACRVVTVLRSGWEQPELAALREIVREDQLVKLQESIIQTPRIDISASDIRYRVSVGRSIRFMVPNSVREYIGDHQLYRTIASAAPAEPQSG